MPIEKALELLNSMLISGNYAALPDEAIALKLAVHALTRVKQLRLSAQAMSGHLLPGETTPVPLAPS